MTRHRGVLIGCGFFARNHMHGWADLASRATLTAVCDADLARAQAFAAEFGIPQAYSSAAAMLEAEAPDFVDIVTTPPSHRALVEMAATRCKLVICQKPIADSVEDARAMVAAVDRAGAQLAIHENFRWQAPLLRLKELSPSLGRLRHGRFEFRHRWDVYAGQPYLAEVERLAIMDVGVHVFDVLRHFLGEAEAISCETQRRNPAVAGEDAFTALTRHTDGAIGICDVSFHSRYDPEPFPQVLARIEGDDGTAELLANYRLLIHDASGHREERVEPQPAPWMSRPWHVVQDSVRAFNAHALGVLDGLTGPQPSGADNLRTLALCMAAYDSAARGERVSLRTPDPTARRTP